MPTLKFNPHDAVIITEAKIHGRVTTTARLVFDTGASLVMIPWKIAVGIGLKIDPKTTIQTTTASTVESSPKVIIPRLNVLGQEIKNVEALIKDLPPQAGVDGLLGLSFIRHFHVQINFSKGELILTKI